VSAIELVAVSKWYGSNRAEPAAVDGLDVVVKTGEFFSLLGPSGCGKSTTLRMIAGFDHPDHGQIYLNGSDVTAVPPNRRDVNMVFQSYALFPHLSVADNIGYGLRRKRVGKAELQQRVGEIVEVMELGALATRKPRELSGGQQQRVALARALVNRPKALLLDEPLGALDLKLRQAMQTELKRIQRDVGITFVYVTHDQGEALVMSDRIAVMSAGRVQQLGTPEEVYQRPANRFVAGFIGASNLLSGPVAGIVDGYGVIEAGAADRVLVPVRDQLVQVGREVHLTIRPERITLGPVAVPTAAQACRLHGRLAETAFLGTSTSYTVRTHGGADLVVHRQNSASHPFSPSVGEDVLLLWDADSGHALA
jgi:spermidine/putrescine transport system ATP-binding protein